MTLDVAPAELPDPVGPAVDSPVPALALGQRAFEIALASSGTDTAWFERHRSTQCMTPPVAWPPAYREVVQARLDLIERNHDIRFLERPEFKRRWSAELWAKREEAALRGWLLDAAERPSLWFEERDDFHEPRALTVSQLADLLGIDADVRAVADLYAARHLGRPDAPIWEVLAVVVESEHVPYLSALRYKDSGLRKRLQWQEVWRQQREEDRTGADLGIKVPPKYSGSDFLKHSYWSNRGKLDVPKERFLSYPGASPDNDPALLLGWAGWNYRDQAQALVNLINRRSGHDGWPAADPRFVPLVAGLREVLPWVEQWYATDDPDWGGNPAEDLRAALRLYQRERGLSDSDLENWRPERKGRKG